MKNTIRATLIFILCFTSGISSHLAAQDEEWVTYTAVDNGFMFSHPASWQVVDEEVHLAALVGELENAAGESLQVVMQVMDPDLVEATVSPSVTEVTSWLLDNMEQLADAEISSVIYGLQKAQRLEVEGGFVYVFKTADYDACMVMVGIVGDFDEHAEAQLFEVFSSLARPILASFAMSGAEPLETTHRFEAAGLEFDLPAGWTTNDEMNAPAVTITNRASFDEFDLGQFTCTLVVTRASWLDDEFADNAPLRVVLTNEIAQEDLMIEDYVTRRYIKRGEMEIALGWGSFSASNPGVILRQMEDGYILKLRFGTASFDQIATALEIIQSARIIGEIPSADNEPLGAADLPPTTDPQQISLATVDSLTEVNRTEIEGDYTQHITGMDLSPDGQWLAVAFDREVLILDVQTFEVVRSRKLLSTEAQDVAFSPDGSTVAIATGVLASDRADKKIVQWELGVAELQEFVLDEHLPMDFVAYHPAGNWLAAYASMEYPYILDAQTGDELVAFERGDRLAFSPAGEWIAVANTLSNVSIYAADGDFELVQQWPMPDNQLANDIKFSPDGRFVAVCYTGVHDGQDNIRVWDVTSGEAYSVTQFSARITNQGIDDDVETFAFSNDSTLLIAGMGNGSIILWDTATGQPIERLNHHSLGIVDILVSPDGQRMYVADFGGKITAWQIGDAE